MNFLCLTQPSFSFLKCHALFLKTTPTNDYQQFPHRLRFLNPQIGKEVLDSTGDFHLTLALGRSVGVILLPGWETLWVSLRTSSGDKKAKEMARAGGGGGGGLDRRARPSNATYLGQMCC